MVEEEVEEVETASNVGNQVISPETVNKRVKEQEAEGEGGREGVSSVERMGILLESVPRREEVEGGEEEGEGASAISATSRGTLPGSVLGREGRIPSRESRSPIGMGCRP